WTYSLAFSMFFRPLGFDGSGRWYSVQVSADAAAAAWPRVDAYTYQQLLEHRRSVDHLGAFASQVAVLSEGQATTSLRAAAISPRLLAATRVAPLLGRTFQETDGQPGAAAMAIISFETWKNYFAGDPDVIGKTARIDAAPVQIVGVMPKDFYAFRDFELWVPLQIPRLARPGDSTVTVSPIIALNDGQSIETVLNEMKPVMDRVNRDSPEVFNAGRHAALFPATRMYTHDDAPIVAMVGFMALAVLLLGCVNISMVFLARLLERSRELALRSALGASRARLLRQSLLETAPVVLLGLVVGYGLAAMGVRWAQGVAGLLAQIQASGRLPFLPELRPIDFIAAVICAVVIWLLSTLVPAWRIARQDAAIVLAGSGKGATLRGSNKSVRLLVGLQVVISCIVLVVCGNVVLAVNKEVSKPTGLNTANALISTAPTVLEERYAEPAQRISYWDELTAAIQSRIPGADVAFITAAPTRPMNVPASIETRQGVGKADTLTLPVSVVSDNYFELLGLSLRSGRLFDSTDNRDSLPVAIVDEQMAARHWPNQDALGKRVQLNPAANGAWLTIVGVVSAVAGRPYRTDDLGVIYQPLRQVVPSVFQLLVKVPNAATVDSRVALRAAAFSVDRDLPLHNLQTVDDDLIASRLTYQAMVPVMIVIAVITAILAASGLFGLISRSVAQRTQEVGIRRALGATSWRATSMFIRQGAIYVTVAIVSIGLGVMMMPALSVAISNIFDHVVLATLGVVLLMVGVIFTASYLPTRRAAALEPGDALRYD
ncbi:MAG TPA: ABC transporter permease, partial [Thermoanaerobaculia bacterium]|nr:ABC transporter permease [Thermoanaerobaculia bacterium]